MRFIYPPIGCARISIRSLSRPFYACIPMGVVQNCTSRLAIPEEG
jgi:hypothetical protein